MVTTSKLNVRATPAGKTIGFQKLNAKGTVIAGPIAKNGYVWWQINYDVNPDGWSAENWLEKVIVAMQSPLPSSGISSSTNTASSFNALTPEQRQLLIASLMMQVQELEERVRGLGR